MRNAIAPARVVLAREARGLTQGELAELVGVSQGKLSKVENGQLMADDGLADRLSAVLNFPILFFEHEVPRPRTTVTFYRRRMSVGVRTMRSFEARLRIRLEHLSVLFASVEHRAIGFVPGDFVELGWRPEKVAAELRAMWGVPRGPIVDLVGLLEAKGIVVVPIEIEDRKIDAVCFPACDGVPPVIFVKANAATDRMRFSLCHELGHLVMHEFVSDLSTDVENEADRFAAEFLMPATDVKGSLARVTLPILAKLKQHWRVSMAALLYRARALGQLTEQQYQYMWRCMAPFRNAEPGDLTPETPSYLCELVHAHLSTLQYSSSELATALRIDESDFACWYGEGDTHRLRIVPGRLPVA